MQYILMTLPTVISQVRVYLIKLVNDPSETEVPLGEGYV